MNRLQVKQIALNLLGNAVKYTVAGKVEFIFDAIVDDGFSIKVRDTGLGIASEDHERVFEAFERAAGNEFPGTGLGFAIVKELVTSLGRDIT